MPETTELAWLLTTVTPMGWLEKCVSYKDKVQQGLPAEHGLFAYPVLQAADILLYDADVVPVGQDQKQHLEITRDIAERFNHVYGGGEEVFRLPEAVHPRRGGRRARASTGGRCPRATTTRSRSSTTGRRSARSARRSSPTARPSRPPRTPTRARSSASSRLFAPADELAEVERRYREGGIGYGEVKTRLAEAIIERFAAAQQRAELGRPPRSARGRECRAAAAARARSAARVVLDRARGACGVG